MTEKRSPGKLLIVPVALSLVMLLGSFSRPQNVYISQANDQDCYQESQKRAAMYSILESLENGKPYSKDDCWDGNNYSVIELPVLDIPDFSDFDFDFDFDFPDIRFDESDMEEFEERMEELQMKIEIKMEEMLRRIEGMHEKYERKVQH